MRTPDVPPALAALAILLAACPDDVGPPAEPTPVDRALPFGVPMVVVPSAVDPLHRAMDEATDEELADWPEEAPIEVDEAELDLN